VRNSIQADKH